MGNPGADGPLGYTSMFCQILSAGGGKLQLQLPQPAAG
jgi:hypothetical protein